MRARLLAPGTLVVLLKKGSSRAPLLSGEKSTLCGVYHFKSFQLVFTHSKMSQGHTDTVTWLVFTKAFMIPCTYKIPVLGTPQNRPPKTLDYARLHKFCGSCFFLFLIYKSTKVQVIGCIGDPLKDTIMASSLP